MLGPWRVLDVDEHAISFDIETANPTLRYNEDDGHWYCLTARKDPKGAAREFWVCRSGLVY